MTKPASIRAKSNAKYICNECGTTERIQAHHEIAGDDSSIVVLCAECHSKRHPEVPRGLFLHKNRQPYWHNKSASSLAKEIGVHPRTVIRVSKRLGVLSGDLSKEDEHLIRKYCGLGIKNSWRVMQRAEKLLENNATLLKVGEVAEGLGISPMTVYRWVRRGKLEALQMDGTIRVEEEALNEFIKKAKERR